MGRTLLLRKDVKTSWNDSAIGIVLSFIDNKVPLPENPINPRTKEKYNYDPLPKLGRFNLQYGYQLANIFFQQIHSQFGCREGVTRSLQDEQHKLNYKRTILVLRENLSSTRGKKDTKLIKDGWKPFVKEFLSCSGIDKDLADKFALVNSTCTTVSFPITGAQKLTQGTLASALLGIIRNSPLLTSKDSFRSYEEMIREMIDALESVWKRTKKTKEHVSAKYYVHTSNVTLWHILHYLDLMRYVPKRASGENPNGPNNFISFNAGGIAKAINKANKGQIKEMLDFIGGVDSELTHRFSANIRGAILDKAKERK